MSVSQGDVIDYNLSILDSLQDLLYVVTHISDTLDPQVNVFVSDSFSGYLSTQAISYCDQIVSASDYSYYYISGYSNYFRIYLFDAYSGLVTGDYYYIDVSRPTSSSYYVWSDGTGTGYHMSFNGYYLSNCDGSISSLAVTPHIDHYRHTDDAFSAVIYLMIIIIVATLFFTIRRYLCRH